eukprot:scaffold121644_cov39-Phaeocystis_antarctica.AAC.1
MATGRGSWPHTSTPSSRYNSKPSKPSSRYTYHAYCTCYAYSAHPAYPAYYTYYTYSALPGHQGARAQRRAQDLRPEAALQRGRGGGAGRAARAHGQGGALPGWPHRRHTGRPPRQDEAGMLPSYHPYGISSPR